MIGICKFIFVPVVMLAFSAGCYAQEKELEQLSSTEKTSAHFPLDYKILKPRLQVPLWDDDYDTYYHFLTPTLRKTQAALSNTDNGVTTTFTPNSVMPLAQLDTATIIKDEKALIGTWRMISFRSIRFNDSVDLATKTYYRLPDSLLDDKSRDEVFAIFTENNLKLYVRENGKTGFKKELSSKYTIENKRFLLLYKFFKSGAGVSQFGTDENGYLLLNYPKVIEQVKKGVYFSYYAIIEQYIFQKIQ